MYENILYDIYLDEFYAPDESHDYVDLSGYELNEEYELLVFD